jgi:hypothetical protein
MNRSKVAVEVPFLPGLLHFIALLARTAKIRPCRSLEIGENIIAIQY